MSSDPRSTLSGRARLLWILACSAVILALVPAAAPAAGPTVVSLTFNDGNASQYSYARPVLAAHGIKATFYVASGWVTAVSNSSMSWSQVRNLYRDGHEIGGMGTDHQNLTTLTAAAAQQQVCGDRQTLTTQGLDPQTFAYPAAAVNAAAESTVQGCGYLAARTIGGLVAPTATTGPWAESIPPADRYAIRTANLPTGAITLSTLQADVNKAAEKGGGWLPISFNQVCHSGSANYSSCMASSKPIDDAVFSQFLDWLQGSGAPAGTTVRTVRDVMGAGAQPPLPVDPTVVSLTFNDALKNQYTYGRPLLQAHHLNGTFYVPSGWVDRGGSAVTAWWQLDDLYRDGNEIGGMGVEHQNLTTLDAATAQQQVCDDRSRLSGQGYDPQTFAYPSGAFNASVESIVQGCGYHAARISGGLSSSGPTYAETLPPKDLFAIRTASSGSPISLTELQTSVNVAADNGGGWVPLNFNQVCHVGAADYSTCMASSRPIEDTVLGSFLAWLDGGGAPSGTTVKTVRDATGAATQPPLSSRPTAVSLTFDDSLISQYTARSVLASHGFHGTFFVNSGPVDRGEAGTMTWAQIASLAADGNDVGGHTRDHVNLKTAATYDIKYHQVCDDRARLIQQGFNPVSFAYPEAAFDATAEEVVRLCGYQTGRTGGSVSPSGPLYAETIPPRDPYATRVLGTTNDGPITLATLQDAVSAASSHGGGWLQTLFHVICDPAASNYSTCMAAYRPVDLPTLQAFADWLANGAPSGVTVKSVAEVMGVAPLVTITTPAGGSTVGGTPQFVGTADAGGGDVAVKVYSGQYPTGTPVAQMTATPTGIAWSVTAPSALAGGVYTVTADQPKGGLTGHSVPTTFTVDGTAPAVTITSPTDGSTVRTATPAIAGTAGTASGDAQTVGVSIYSGTDTTGTALQTLSAPVTSGTWTVTPSTALAAGQYSAVATQSNSLGTVGTSSPVRFTVDLTGPTVTVTSPTGGQVVTSATPTVAGTASSTGDVTVRVYAGSTATGTPSQTLTAPVTSSNWSSTTTALADGTYTVVAEQRDAFGNTGSSAPVTFSVAAAPAPTAPTAAFTATPTSGQAPLPVQFTDTSTGNPTSWAWNFGDNTTATTQNPAHTYAAAGTYTATLTATNAVGASTPATTTITVTAAPTAPTAAFTATPTSGQAPLPVQFTDTSTGSPTSWAWNFGDNTTATTQNPTHTYAAAGTYTATLTATNAVGASTPATTTITVTAAPTAPTAAFTATPTSGQAPLPVQFTDTSTGSPTSWAWNFGDNTTATTQNPTHTYAAAGTYTATLTATNALGSSSATTTVTVAKAPIRARSSTTASGTATDVVLTRPAGVATGDVLVVEITSDAAPSMNTVPAGWTSIVAAPLTVGTTARAWAYYHVVGNAAAEPASYRWVLSAKQKWSGLVTAFSGVDNATPFDTVTSSAVRTTAGTTLAVPGVTTVTPGAMLIGAIGLSNPGTSATPPSGWTVASDSLSTQRTVLADRLTTAAGASGTMTWTLSKSTVAGGWLTALRPAP